MTRPPFIPNKTWQSLPESEKFLAVAAHRCAQEAHKIAQEVDGLLCPRLVENKEEA